MGASDFYTYAAGEDCAAALNRAIEDAAWADGNEYSGTISMKRGYGAHVVQAAPVPIDAARKLAQRTMDAEYAAVEHGTFEGCGSGYTEKDGPVGAIAVGPAKAYKRRARAFTMAGDGNPWQEATRRYGDSVSEVAVTEDDRTTKVVKTAGPAPERTRGYEVCDGHGRVIVYGIPSVAAATKHAETLLAEARFEELHVRRASGVIRFVEKKTKRRKRRVEVTVMEGSTSEVAGWLFFGTARS